MQLFSMPSIYLFVAGYANTALVPICLRMANKTEQSASVSCERRKRKHRPATTNASSQ